MALRAHRGSPAVPASGPAIDDRRVISRVGPPPIVVGGPTRAGVNMVVQVPDETPICEDRPDRFSGPRTVSDAHCSAPPRADDPSYIAFLTELVEAHGVSAVIPLTDLDLEVLARSDLPAFTPTADVCKATFDKYLAHQLLLEHGLPSPPTWLPGEQPESFPAVVGHFEPSSFHPHSHTHKHTPWLCLFSFFLIYLSIFC